MSITHELSNGEISNQCSGTWDLNYGFSLINVLIMQNAFLTQDRVDFYVWDN